MPQRDLPAPALWLHLLCCPPAPFPTSPSPPTDQLGSGHMLRGRGQLLAGKPNLLPLRLPVEMEVAVVTEEKW